MEHATKNPAQRRYRVCVLVAMAFYTLFLIADLWIFRHAHPARMLACALAVLPALPIIGVLAIAGLYLAKVKDEFQHTIMTIQSVLWSIGGDPGRDHRLGLSGKLCTDAASGADLGLPHLLPLCGRLAPACQAPIQIRSRRVTFDLSAGRTSIRHNQLY